MISINDIKGQVEILNNRIAELVTSYVDDDQEGTSDIKTRDLIEDIILKERRILDKLIEYYFVKHIYPSSKNSNTKIQTFFPFCKSSIDLDKCYKKYKIESINDINKRLFQILDKYQPYQTNYEWLSDLREYSNLGHRELIKVSKDKYINGLIFGGARIIAKNIDIRFANIEGIDVDELKTTNGKIMKCVGDDSIQKLLEFRYSYCVKDANIDVILLCKNGYELIFKIIDEFE